MKGKIIVVLMFILLIVLCLFTFIEVQGDAYASTYEYVIDSQNFFDNSNDMIRMY